MPKQTKPLTDTEIKAAKNKEKDYSLYDGDGLNLLVKATGNKIWQFRYSRPANGLILPTNNGHTAKRGSDFQIVLG